MIEVILNDRLVRIREQRRGRGRRHVAHTNAQQTRDKQNPLICRVHFHFPYSPPLLCTPRWGNVILCAGPWSLQIMTRLASTDPRVNPIPRCAPSPCRERRFASNASASPARASSQKPYRKENKQKTTTVGTPSTSQPSPKTETDGRAREGLGVA
jgi:hypothetical protein